MRVYHIDAGFLLFANVGSRVGHADEAFERVNLPLLLFDNLLLLADGVDQNGCELPVFHAFDLAFLRCR